MSDSAVVPAEIRLLPVWSTVKLAYAALRDHFRDALTITWPWLSFVVPVVGYSALMQAHRMQAIFATIPPTVVEEPWQLRPLAIAYMLAFIVGGACMAVAWHRLLILDEPPTMGGHSPLRAQTWQYLAAGILISAFCLTPIVGAMFLGARFLPPFLHFFAVLTLMILLLGASARLVLVLPARAIGDRQLSFIQALKLTRGHNIEMFWGSLLCTLPWLVALQVVAWLSGAMPRPHLGPPGTAPIIDVYPERFAAFNAVTVIAYALLILVWVGFLSYSYRHFCEAEHPPASGGSEP